LEKIELCERNNCTGCFACFSACPAACIAMKEDKEGFLYPVIDETRCLSCGRCRKACPVLSEKKKASPPAAKASYAKDETLREESSSGGVFSVLAESVLERGGVVFGAAFNEGMELCHVAVEKMEDLALLRGSKYVQSRIGDAFSLAKRYLEQGRCVLFSGTPCQIGGLKSFLSREYANLITVDVICHGVPSPLAWAQYLRSREKKGRKVKKVSFRHKKLGWKKYGIRLDFQKGKSYYSPLDRDPYLRGFLADLYLRPSCYACSCKGNAPASDLTLADFWGVEKVLPQWNDDRGVSLILVHSEQGKALLEKSCGKRITVDIDAEEALQYNRSYYASPSKPQAREKALVLISEMDFDEAMQLLQPKITLLQRVFRKLRCLLR